MNVENIIAIYNILNYKNENLTLKKEKRFNKHQNVIFFIMIIFFVGALLLGLLNKLNIRFTNQRFFSLLLAFLSQIMGVLLNIHFIIGSLKSLVNPVEKFFINLTRDSIKDNSIIAMLLECKIEDLNDAKAHIEFEQNQIIKHVKKIIGPIEIAGLLPSLIAIYGAFNDFPYADSIFYFVVGLFIGAMSINYTLQQIEKKKYLLDYAIKQLDKNNDVK